MVKPKIKNSLGVSDNRDKGSSSRTAGNIVSDVLCDQNISEMNLNNMGNQENFLATLLGQLLLQQARSTATIS